MFLVLAIPSSKPIMRSLGTRHTGVGQAEREAAQLSGDGSKSSGPRHECPLCNRRRTRPNCGVRAAAKDVSFRHEPAVSPRDPADDCARLLE